MIHCLSCNAETSNGLALCDLCREFTLRCLDMIPVYFRNLSRWRPGRAGSRPVPGSREPSGPSPIADDRVSRALDETGNDLVGWVRRLKDDRGIEVPDGDGEAAQTEAVCLSLADNLVSVSTLDWCGELVVDLRRIEAWLRGLTERVIPGWYAGSCQRVAGFDEDGAAVRCETDTFVVPGLTWVTCGGCGATTYARDHLPTILAEARDWTARPKDIAGAIVALVDGEQSVPRLYDRIRKWESLEWLTGTRRTDRDGHAVGAKLYRFGDVLDLALGQADAPTRPMRMTSA